MMHRIPHIEHNLINVGWVVLECILCELVVCVIFKNKYVILTLLYFVFRGNSNDQKT